MMTLVSTPESPISILAWCEGQGPIPEALPDALAPLYRAGRAIDTLRLDDARRELDLLRFESNSVLSRVAALFEAQLCHRHGDLSSRPSLESFVTHACSSAAVEEAPVRARALLVRAVSALRYGDRATAERCIPEAVALAPEGDAVRVHAANAWATLMQSLGAWLEAEFMLERLVELRANDPVGAAISAGALGRQWLDAGKLAEGTELIERTISRHEHVLSRLSVVRLRTLALELALARGDAASRRSHEGALALVAVSGKDSHVLDGYALLAIAMSAGHDGRLNDARSAIESARVSLTFPSGRMAVDGRAAIIFRDQATFSGILESMRATSPSLGLSDDELELRLCATRIAFDRGDRPEASSQLRRTYELAMLDHHPGRLLRIDRLCEEVDPLLHAEQSLGRFVGGNLEALDITRRAVTSVVFADMVGYSVVSQTMTPEVVMETVRGLFELAAVSLVEHGLTPVNFLGDAVLAVAEGPDHALRATRFACDFVARVMRVGRMRIAFGANFGPRLRAGVATGTVVRGALGVQLKRDFAVIGVPTNLAARLQGLAEPGEVVASADVAISSRLNVPISKVDAKGWDAPVPIVRLDAESFCGSLHGARIGG